MTNTELNSRCPREWEGRSRRVQIETPAGTFHGWELTEDIEGYCSAGQIWLDGDEDSSQPAGDWVIEDES